MNLPVGDLTVIQATVEGGLAEIVASHDAQNPHRTNTIRLDPANGSLGNGSSLPMIYVDE